MQIISVVKLTIIVDIANSRVRGYAYVYLSIIYIEMRHTTLNKTTYK